MQKLPRRIIVIPPYNRKCLVLIGFSNLKECVHKYKMGKELASLFNELPSKDDSALLLNDTRGRYILWLPSRKVSNETLNHEATHLVDAIHRYVGEGNADEYRAYFPAWFNKEVRKVL